MCICALLEGEEIPTPEHQKTLCYKTQPSHNPTCMFQFSMLEVCAALECVSDGSLVLEQLGCVCQVLVHLDVKSGLS